MCSIRSRCILGPPSVTVDHQCLEWDSSVNVDKMQPMSAHIIRCQCRSSSFSRCHCRSSSMLCRWLDRVSRTQVKNPVCSARPARVLAPRLTFMRRWNFIQQVTFTSWVSFSWDEPTKHTYEPALPGSRCSQKLSQMNQNPMEYS